MTHRDTLQRNNPNLHIEMGENPMWDFREYDDVLEDDELPAEDDPTCPTILLTAQEKRMLREHWRDALIVKLFDKGVGYM